MVTPAARKEGAHWLMRRFTISERRACRLTGSVRSTQRYRSRRQEPEGLREAIREVAFQHPRYGYRRVHWVVVRDGHRTGMCRLRRMYREEGLTVRRRRRKRLKAVVRRPMTPPTSPGQRWSMDFVHDQLADGRRFRVFTAVDDFTCKSVVLRVGTSLPSSCVTLALEHAMQAHGVPEVLVCDNGPEFTSLEFMKWAACHRIDVQHIQPGKPMQNAFCESFNGSFRDECLNTTWSASLPEARRRIEAWRTEYNTERPHSSLGNQTPNQFERTWRAAA